jgi:tripartite motif-containing protein 71
MCLNKISPLSPLRLPYHNYPSSGDVYATDTENFNVQKFDVNGNFITKWGSEGEGNGQFASLESLDVDSSGNVYVADFGNNRIQKFTSEGTFITKWGSEGEGDGQFSEPEGIDVDDLGHVYVADTGNFRIQVFALTRAATANDNNNTITSSSS